MGAAEESDKTIFEKGLDRSLFQVVVRRSKELFSKKSKSYFRLEISLRFGRMDAKIV
jgi:hypothetical protein